MAEMNGEDVALMHEMKAQLTRCITDVAEAMEHCHSANLKMAVVAQRIERLEQSMDDLLGDKQGVFKWALGAIASFILVAAGAVTALWGKQ